MSKLRRFTESEVMKSENRFSEGQGPRVRLRNPLSGEIVHWPGVCRRENGWTLDASRFHVRDLIGSIVVAKYLTTGENDLSKQMKVQALLSCDGQAAPGGF